MPRSASPPNAPRRRTPSPRRDRERDERRHSERDRPSDGDRDRDRDRDRRRDRYDDRPRRPHDDRDGGHKYNDGERHRERDRSDRRRDDRDRDRPRERETEPNRHPSGPSSDRAPPRPRSRSRSRSPPRAAPRRAKELSFYKKSSSSMGSFSTRRDPLEEVEETEKERLQRRERGEVPARFGGTKEQGVRNTMSRVAPQGSAPSGMGSFRRGVDPLDRMGSKGGDAPGGGAGGNMGGGRAGDGDRMRQERVAAMDKPRAVAPGAAAGGAKFIEVIANSRMGGKVRVKCLPTDTVGDLKKLIAAQTGTTAQKIQLKKWQVLSLDLCSLFKASLTIRYTNFKDHVSLQDYEINDGMSLEMY